MSVSALTSASQQTSSSGARLLQLLRGDSASATTSTAKTGHKGPRPSGPPPSGPPPGPPPPGPLPTVPGNSSGSDAKSLFDALSSSDTNGDGVLSADEIATSAASGVMSDDFGSIDSDGDGELNETEVGSFESAVNEVLGAMGSAATIGQMVDAASQSSMDQVQGRHHHHGPPSDASFGMDEATATVVADALTSVLNAADANKDSTLSGGELTSYLANASSSDARSNSLAESIVKAMANQSAKASNQEVLAQQYTNILQTLSA